MLDDVGADEAGGMATAEGAALDELVTVVAAAVSRHRRAVLARCDLTPTALAALRVLGSVDRLSHRELAGRLVLSPGALTSVIDALEGAGAVARRRDPTDRRIVRLSITATGRTVLGRATEAVRGGDRACLARLTPEREQVVRDYLLDLLAAVRVSPVSELASESSTQRPREAPTERSEGVR